jgi:hypothetical protein
MTYLLPKNRDVRVAYSLQRYIRRSGDRTLGHGLDCFLTFFSLPSMDAEAGVGYSTRIVEEDYVHLGILRGQISPRPTVHLTMLSESGILNNRKWDNEFVLHLRGSFRYQPRPNLECSFHVEENRNPYFDSDLRGMVFVRYFWGRRK